MSRKPTRLFKYLSPERLSILDDGLLRFTQPGDFNDPFEMRAPLRRVISSDEMWQELRREAREPLLQRLRQDPANKEISDASLTKIVDSFAALAKSQATPLLEKARQDFCDAMNDELMPNAANNALGVLCLSETATSALMWGHYTSSYAGFVLEIDANHPFFACPNGMHPDVDSLTRVRYVFKRPSLDLKSDNALSFMLTKGREWMYECEWRMVRPLDQSQKVVQREPFPIHLFHVPPTAIKSVILGHRMSESNFDQIRKLLACATREHIALRRIELHRYEYSLKVKSAVTWDDLRPEQFRARAAKQSIARLHGV